MKRQDMDRAMDSIYAARARCNRSKHPAYRWYGAKGIRAATPEALKSALGPRPYGAHLGRKIHSGDYRPGNVQWEPLSYQSLLRRDEKLGLSPGLWACSWCGSCGRVIAPRELAKFLAGLRNPIVAVVRLRKAERLALGAANLEGRTGGPCVMCDASSFFHTFRSEVI